MKTLPWIWARVRTSFLRRTGLRRAFTWCAAKSHVSITMLLCAVLLSSCVTAQPISLATRTAIPWPGLERAIAVAHEVLATEYPNQRFDFRVALVGQKDPMIGDCSGTGLQGLGCTYKEAGSWVIAIRELWAEGHLADPSVSSLFWEICDRLVPEVLRWPMPPCSYSDVNCWHNQPSSVSLREKMEARYYAPSK